MPRRWLILFLILLAPALTSTVARAGDALQPTVDQLQTSAIDLYAQMINPTTVAS